MLSGNRDFDVINIMIIIFWDTEYPTTLSINTIPCPYVSSVKQSGALLPSNRVTGGVSYPSSLLLPNYSCVFSPAP